MISLIISFAASLDIKTMIIGEYNVYENNLTGPLVFTIEFHKNQSQLLGSLWKEIDDKTKIEKPEDFMLAFFEIAIQQEFGDLVSIYPERKLISHFVYAKTDTIELNITGLLHGEKQYTVIMENITYFSCDFDGKHYAVVKNPSKSGPSFYKQNMFLINSAVAMIILQLIMFKINSRTRTRKPTKMDRENERLMQKLNKVEIVSKDGTEKEMLLKEEEEEKEKEKED